MDPVSMPGEAAPVAEAEPLRPGSGARMFDMDILQSIFERMDHHTLARAAVVCRQWREVSSQPEFWGSVALSGGCVRPSMLLTLCSWKPHIQSLNLTPCGLSQSALAEVFAAFRHLESLAELRLGGCSSIPPALLKGLSVQCPSLRLLSVTGAALDSERPQRARRLSITHPRLETLELVDCTFGGVVSLKCPLLTCFSLSGSKGRPGYDAINAAHLRCPELRSLDFSRCQRLPGACLQRAARSCSRLTSLNVCGYYYMTDEILASIAERCKLLQELNASNCPRVTLSRIPEWPKLQSLTLRRCRSVKALSSSILPTRCPRLSILDLQGCQSLSHVKLSMHTLVQLSLAGCARLAEVVVHSAALEELDISWCKSLRSVEVHSPSLRSLMLEGCIHLEKVKLGEVQLPALNFGNCPDLMSLELSSSTLTSLKLGWCRKLSNLCLRCPELQDVDAHGCSQLTDARLMELQSTAPSISSLVLTQVSDGIWDCLAAAPSLHSSVAGDGCVAGTLQSSSVPGNPMVVVSASAGGSAHPARALRSLSLVGCPKLRRLRLHCDAATPHLTALNLTSCKNLAAVSLASSTLQSLRLTNCESLDTICLECPCLTSLFLQDCPVSAPTLEQSVVACPALETLDIRCCTQIGSDVLRRIRQSAPNLRRIYTTHDACC